MSRLLPLALAALALAGCADEEATSPDPIRAETDVVDETPGEPVEDGAILGDGIQNDDPLLEGDAVEEGSLDDL